MEMFDAMVESITVPLELMVLMRSNIEQNAESAEVRFLG